MVRTLIINCPPVFFRNKCHNEKKRRELENATINQLEELLSTCLAEVKQPDKNGIVSEATRQIEEVLRRRKECPEECPLRAAQGRSPVQAGEVSSTQPSCAGLHYSETNSLIEVFHFIYFNNFYPVSCTMWWINNVLKHISKLCTMHFVENSLLNFSN